MGNQMEKSYRDEYSLRFLHPLANRDPNARKQAIESLIKTITAWLNGYSTPFNSSDSINCVQVNKVVLIQELLPDMVQLMYCCPFDDIRNGLTHLVDEIKKSDKGLKIPRRLNPASLFIPECEIVPVYSKEDQTQMLFIDAFLQNNRLDNVTQVMGYHPDYLECFLRTQQYLLRGDGPLPYHFRHYIAIMAAGRHQCSYLINLHIQEFILAGGDQEWLKGLEHIPQKLRDLYQINQILAHRPWLISKSHVEKLTKGKDNWSVSELVHAIILLANFHALSSFVYGCGITPEVDHEGGYSYKPATADDQQLSRSIDSTSSNESNGSIENLMERMKKLTETDDGEMTQEELVKQFEKIEHQSAELTPNSYTPSPKKDILKFVNHPEFTYQDFAKRESTEAIPTFRAQEYSWEDHGFSLANRYYSEIGTLLDDKFTCAYNLTYYTLGNKMNVDTTTFRRAIWNYIHCMYGIRHDDYNYSEVNQMLEKNLKQYIKTVTCYPERLTKKDYDSVMRGFKHSEKVHVNLVLLEARLQGELLYSLRAVMQHMT